MLNLEYQNSISETLDIINNMEISYKEKIPKKFMNFLIKNQSNSYINHINPNIAINEQITGAKPKELLAIITYSFWYDENEKEQYMKKLQENIF